MEKETKEKIEKIVGDILKESDLSKMTELKAREIASERLGIDLSEKPYETIVRRRVNLFISELEKARKLSEEVGEWKEDLDMKKKLEELDKEDLEMKKISSKKLVGFDILRYRMRQEICDDRWSPCPPLVRLYAKYGLHRYNMLQGTNLQLIRVKKYVKTTHSAASSYYITLAAMDPATTKLITFLAQVAEESYGKLILSCSIARPLGANTDDDGADYVFLSGLCMVLPEFPPEDLFENRKRFYLVKESELEHNDWIRLYLELAIVTTHRNFPEKLDLSSLKIEKVAIETTKKEEEDMEEETLNNEGSLNAIVYIRYKDFCEARVGKDVDRIAIVRRTFNQSEGCFILRGRTQRFEFMPQKE